MDVGWYDAGDEEEAVYEGVRVGACEEEDGERGEEDVYEGEAEAREHVCGTRACGLRVGVFRWIRTFWGWSMGEYGGRKMW